MRRARILLIAFLGLAFPLALGAAVYAAAGRSLASPPPSLVGVSTAPVARPATTTSEREDLAGPCDEAEHRGDARCARGSAARDDRSGRSGRSARSGPSGRSGSDDSGSRGSGDSGSDSGSDD
jgi:hypothetical protein